MDHDNKDKRILPRNITPAMITFGRKAWTSVLILEICILLGIFAFGSSKGLIKSSTAVLKIDTRKATVNDIIGGIELISFGLASDYPDDSLKNLTEILEEIDSYVTVEDFSLGRIFGIHDHLYLANSGYRCWSDNTSIDHLTDDSDSFNNCPNNRFMLCLGNIYDTSNELAPAYASINSLYLSKTTSLNNSEISNISRLWYHVSKNSISSSLRLNLDDRAFKSISKLFCGDDYVNYHIKGNSKLKASTTVILGILGLLFAISIAIVQIFSIIAAAVCWLISFVMVIAMFGVSLSSNIPAAKYINKSEGIRAESAKGGLVAYFVVLLILFLILLLLLLRGFNTRKRLQAYKAEQERLNNLETGSNNINQTNPEESKSGLH